MLRHHRPVSRRRHWTTDRARDRALSPWPLGIALLLLCAGAGAGRIAPVTAGESNPGKEASEAKTTDADNGTAATQAGDSEAGREADGETEAVALTRRYAPKDGYYALRYPKAWQAQTGQGFVQLSASSGPAKGGHIRIYAIGLREAGGKYRNLEHAVDDGIFQIRDEMKGSVEKKTTHRFQGADRAFEARQFLGQFKQKGKVQFVRWMVTAHELPGIVVAINLVAPEQGFKAANADLDAILGTLRLAAPPPPEAAAKNEEKSKEKPKGKPKAAKPASKPASKPAPQSTKP